MIKSEVVSKNWTVHDLKEVVAKQTLQFLEPCSPHAAIMHTPTIKGLFRDPNVPDHIYTRHYLADKNLNLSLIRDNLLRIVAFIRHL